MASAKQERANELAQAAGFRNDYEYRQTRREFDNEYSGLGLPSLALREMYAMRAGVWSPPYNPGSDAWEQYWGRLAKYLRDADLDPSEEFEALESPDSE